MRATIILLLTIIYISVFGQGLTGEYNDYHGHSLDLKQDSTFRYEWKFDLAMNWAVGRWKISDDFIILDFRNVYDTLHRLDKTDSLVLSGDERSTRISSDQFVLTLISSSTQRHDGITNRLCMKKHRLYLVDSNGGLITERREGIWDKKKRPTWYSKSE